MFPLAEPLSSFPSNRPVFGTPTYFSDPVEVDGWVSVVVAAACFAFLLLRLSDPRTLVLTFTFSKVRERSVTFGERRQSPNVVVTSNAVQGLCCSGFPKLEPVRMEVADPKEENARGKREVDPVSVPARVDGVAEKPVVDLIRMGGGEVSRTPRRSPPAVLGN
ncbi:hypothetical protein JTB14_012645 [Gonioctena quinquepunctata]|nr:hypothetical protein JTB14_012645 [Gonioctena quinquepunctata]